MAVIETRVNASADDAEQSGLDSSVTPTGAVLDMGSGDNTSHIGMRFANVTIPQGVTVSNAYIEFYAHASTSGAVDMDIYGEDVDDSTAFTTATNNIGGRTLTTAKIDWAPGAWTANTTYQVTGLGPIVQEIVNRGGWSSGNALTFIFVEMASSDRRRAKTYDGDAANAPLLHVEYSSSSGGSQDVTISTGTDDATEIGWSGEVRLTETNVPIGEHLVGLRFPSVNAPQGATITNAYITFDSSGGDSGACSVPIWCEDADDAATFSSSTSDISDRTPTAAQVDWPNIPAWTSLELYDTPDLKTIVQEVVDRPGWEAGNALAFLFGEDEGGARRRARTVENGTGDPPTLTIEWTENVGSAIVISKGYSRDTVVVEARQSAPAVLSMGYSLDTVVASVDATEVVQVFDFGGSVDTVTVSVNYSVVVEDRGFALDMVFVPVEARAVILDRGFALDTVSAIAVHQVFSGALSIGQSKDIVVAVLATQTLVTLMDIGQSRDTVIATVVVGQPVNQGLEPPGMLTGIVHQLDIAYRDILGA